MKIVSRGDIAELVQAKLKPTYNPAVGQNPFPNPLAKLADLTDAVIDEIEGNVGVDDISWDGIKSTIDYVLHMEEEK